MDCMQVVFPLFPNANNQVSQIDCESLERSRGFEILSSGFCSFLRGVLGALQHVNWLPFVVAAVYFIAHGEAVQVFFLEDKVLRRVLSSV